MSVTLPPIELGAIWEALITGTYKVQSWSHTKTTWSLVVSRRRPSEAPGLRPRDVKILKQALLSGRREPVAAKTGLSLSSIYLILQNSLHFMGINCTPGRLPAIIVVAAHAHHQSRATRRFFPNNPIRKITISRPDLQLAVWLSPAEQATFRLLVEGRSHAEIARARQTSPRTVANQVVSGFRRLGVSGRAELLSLLAAWTGRP